MNVLKISRLSLILFISITGIILLNACQSKHEKQMTQLKQMSRGASLVEKGYPGFWVIANKSNELEITSLDKDSDASHKGFHEGDILKLIDGVVIENKYTLFKVLDRKKPNDTISMVVNRNGKLFSKQIELTPILLPNTLYALFEPIYKNESVILAVVVAEFNVAGFANQETKANFRKTILPQLLSIAEGQYINIFRNEKNFKIIDRNDIEHLINELKLQQSGLISKDSQLKLGHMLGATHLLIVNYSFFPLNKEEVSCMVAQRLTDIESGMIIATTVSELKTNDPKIIQVINKSKAGDSIMSRKYSNSVSQIKIDQYTSRKNNLSIKYDINKWNISKTKQNEEAEIEFIHKDGDIYAFLINEKYLTNMSQQVVNNYIIENIKKKGIINDCTLLSSKTLNVNGQSMDHLYIEGNFKDHTLSIIFYVYTGNSGTVQFYIVLPKDLNKEYETDIYNLLNGLHIVASQVFE